MSERSDEGFHKKLQQLRPLLGHRAERWRRIYLAEDDQGRREVFNDLQRWESKRITVNGPTGDLLLAVPDEKQSEGEMPIGEIIHGDRSMGVFFLRREELTKHLLAVGDTGSGKTVFLLDLMANFLAAKPPIPFWVYDWKHSFSPMLLTEACKNTLLYTVGGSASPFRFNFLIPPPGVPASLWRGAAASVMADVYFLGHGAIEVLDQLLISVYQTSGLQREMGEGVEGQSWEAALKNLHSIPTISDLDSAIKEKNLHKGRSSLWAESVGRTLSALSKGIAGEVFDTIHVTNIAELTTRSIIFEFSLSSLDKRMFVTMLSTWLYYYRLYQGERGELKHALIFDEAHHVFLKRRGEEGSEPITDVLLREARELGECLVLADQAPSKMTDLAFGVYTKLILNLGHRSDIKNAADALLLDEKEARSISQLPAGVGILRMKGRYASPFLIRIPHVQMRKERPTPDQIRSHMERLGYSGHRQPEIVQKEASRTLRSTETSHEKRMGASGKSETRTVAAKSIESLSGDARALLTDIINHPFDGARERYDRLTLSSRRGTQLKEKLIKDELITEKPISGLRARRTLWELTERGESALRVKPNRNRGLGGIEHRYWIEQTSHALKQCGYHIKIEKRTNTGERIDIEAFRGSQVTAVEVEMRSANVKRTVDKCRKAGYSRILALVVEACDIDRLKSRIQPSSIRGLTFNIHAIKPFLIDMEKKRLQQNKSEVRK